MNRLALALLTIALACDEAPAPVSEARPGETVGETVREAVSAGEATVDPGPVQDDPPRPAAQEYDLTEGPRLGMVPDGLGLALGAVVPEDSTQHVEDVHGNAVTLSALLEDGPLMVVFYRGGWCPYCNFQVHAVTESYALFEARGVTPVLVSVDRVEEASRTQATYEIPFPVLSDPDLVFHRLFRVVHEADAAEVARLRGFGLDIEASSGRDHHDFAVPSIFIIDRDGKVRWRHADLDYRVRPSIAQLVEVLDELDMVAAD